MRSRVISFALSITLMAVASLDLWSQAGQKPAGDKAFQTLGISDGLRSNSVTSLLADSRGYLWIGTTQGLNRYDGYEVRTRFPESGERQLSEVFHQPVTSIEEDSDGRIWIECESGAYYLYDTHTARFSATAGSLLQQMGIRPDGRYKVKVGSKGLLWVLSKGRIYRYDTHAKELRTWEVSLALPGTGGNLVVEMSNGLYFSAAHAVWHLNTATGELRQQVLPEVMQQSAGENSLLADADGTLWVYSTREENICRLIVGGRYVREMITLPQTPGASQNNAIRDMMDDGRGNIWIATDHKGLFAYNKDTGFITSMRHHPGQILSIASDNATCLTVDREGTVWVGHLKTGLSYTNDASSIMIPHARQCGDIMALAYDTQGNLWMGTDGDGVYIERVDGTIIKTSLPNITVMALLSDGQGGMWVGTYNQGLYHLTKPTQWKKYTLEDGTFPTEYAWTMARDGNGDIWTSSPIGKTVIFHVGDERAQVVTSDKGDDIHGNSLLYDGKGTMYVGSVYGLWSCDIKSGRSSVTFGNRQGTQQWMSQMITGLAIDSLQQFMVLCHREGVTVYDMLQDSLYTHPRSDDIKGMVSDREGTYWFCTTDGSVAGLRPERHPPLTIDHSPLTIDHSPSTLHFTRRSFMAGAILPQFYFNGTAMVCSPQGDILLGGTEGYITIDHSPLTIDPSALTITEIAIGDSLLNEQTTTVNLSHDAAFLTVKFFSGNLGGVSRSRYAYRLVGQMANWVTTDGNHVSFHALPPGNYTLQLCVQHEDGTMGTPRELKISVAPPFYRTLPMYILYAVIVLGVLYLLWRNARKRQRERSEQQRQLMERQKTEQVTEMKLQFFTNISHDLRTPLTLIISPLEQIVKKREQEAQPSPSTLLSQRKNIHKNAQQLLREVSALLDFRRLDAGGETLNLQRGDIVDHLNSILVSFGDYAEERGIRLGFEHDVESFVMDYDREKMQKVVYNLFSNALKFTPAGGSVSLSFRQEENNVTITVSDTGKGIPDSYKPNIFSRFYQSATNDSSQTGSGIGLHIASEYVRLHHGTITVTDNQPVGSIFTITLPVKSGECRVESVEFATALESSASGSPEANSSLFTLHSSLKSPSTLLLVDDNRDMLSFLHSCMKEHYKVFTATDGAAALDIVQREQIDLIVSDVMMPGIDGFELCRRVKTDISLSHIPIILLTARTTDVSRIEGLQLGADDYLTKPFNIEVLRLRVKKVLEWEQKAHRTFRQKIDVQPSEITITPLDEQFIQRAIALIEANISDSDFSVETLAAHVAMSRSTLYKKLMAITGLGPSEFIRTIRVKRGKALLETSQLQVTEIAYAVGFSTVKSFTMNFKALYGITPSEFLASRP